MMMDREGAGSQEPRPSREGPDVAAVMVSAVGVWRDAGQVLEKAHD